MGNGQLAMSELVIHLDTMTVADYAALLVALQHDDHMAVIDILDCYTEGGLKERHWLNYWLALQLADEHIEAGKAALMEARAAVAFASMCSQE